MKRDRLTPLLNGFDVKTYPHDGLAHFAYTGRGWVCWRDGIILGTGWADIDPRWFERLCRFINGQDVSPFVYLGFGSPTFGSAQFARWLDKEAKIRGFAQSEEKLEVLTEVKLDLASQ
jgi:hypothetical protein